jgi:hypothetical protein
MCGKAKDGSILALEGGSASLYLARVGPGTTVPYHTIPSPPEGLGLGLFWALGG